MFVGQVPQLSFDRHSLSLCYASATEAHLWLGSRRPGQSRITTPRKESDTCEIYTGKSTGRCPSAPKASAAGSSHCTALPAGVSEAGITEGDPILIIVPNKTQRSQDYSEMEVAYRCFLLCCVQGGAPVMCLKALLNSRCCKHKHAAWAKPLLRAVQVFCWHGLVPCLPHPGHPAWHLLRQCTLVRQRPSKSSEGHSL